MNEMAPLMPLEELKKKFPTQYHEFLNVFDKEKATHLPPYCSTTVLEALSEQDTLPRILDGISKS